MINELKICKLYNEIDVTIPFSTSGVKILVSENGMGKTTVLKILYAVLTREFYKLDAIDFEKIVLTFNEDKVTIRQSDLHRNYMTELPQEFKMLRDALTESSCKILLDSVRRLSLKELKEMPLLEYSAKVMETPRAYLAQLLKRFKFVLNESLSDTDRKIANSFSSEVLYLPTFRRIEEDLRNLGLVSQDLLKLDELLRSGMQDIQEKIDKATWEIQNAIDSRLKGEQWFFELAKVLNILDDTRADDTEHLKAVLDHIGGDISENGLDSFLNQVDPNILNFIPYETDKEDKYEILKERLAGVMKTYTYQKQKQKDINEFVRTCNKYLIDKEIVYDETQGHTKFVKVGGSELDSMEKMSSGEKQIVSLFARLYFDFEKTCLVIIDEPENSMSIEWQKMLLPDILETPKCGYLIAATHSPFIFNNDLNLHTVALDEYIRRSD